MMIRICEVAESALQVPIYNKKPLPIKEHYRH
jgi:hypothetical protein